ncbi:family 10 glycosylhydrolase [Cohnella lubricantis]|uniref:Family 10 glycosylhydrolase n=1 Tax=Cohnella lubricantis TaxID=2163172 RepID=A0A841T5L9_9BACL|nr:family 10 glycosylhydrolase [Cohnella lubricantis]MBB6676614.1 family 10 glycosylhydrolase [Cohnella lubricantis]MBP2117375.1 uncharacterized lipoprotein YddW (UPF0748 family) [Cohnella lubricantis]
MRMRKLTAACCLLVLLSPLTPLEGRSEAADSDSSLSLVLDGLPLKSDTAPYMKPKVNVTMVPARVISENLGATVGWVQSNRTATVTGSGMTIQMTAGKQEAVVNGATVKLDASVEVKNGRVMVPLRFISEKLGLLVGWNQATQTVSLTSRGSGNGSAQAPGAISERTVVRGAWLSSIYNLDWPSDDSYNNASQQQEEYRKQLDDLQAMGINTVYVQVRPSGDALYPSSLVPWSKFLTGTQGKDPGYDPLAFMIEETHSRGMKFEAWFNPFRANNGTSAAGLAANHVAIQHPDWVVAASGTTYINPGIPDARQHIIDAIMEVVNKYDVDGIHLDDYFYPSNASFDDDAAYKQYNTAGFASKADWRRDNINQFIRKLGESIHAAKPQLAFGVSPFGVWRNSSADPEGSNTRASITDYDSMYADVRKWIQEEWIDYVVPQVYWSLSTSAARYDIVTDWWADAVEGTDVKLYIGHSPYKLGTSEAGWQSAQEIIHQLQYNSKIEQVEGDVFFSAKDLLKNPLGLVPLLSSYYGS